MSRTTHTAASAPSPEGIGEGRRQPLIREARGEEETVRDLAPCTAVVRLYCGCPGAAEGLRRDADYPEPASGRGDDQGQEHRQRSGGNRGAHPGLCVLVSHSGWGGLAVSDAVL